jgi:hypothetical protein
MPRSHLALLAQNLASDLGVQRVRIRGRDVGRAERGEEVAPQAHAHHLPHVRLEIAVWRLPVLWRRLQPCTAGCGD